MGVVAGVVAFLYALPQLLSILAKLGEVLSDDATKTMLNDLEKAIDKLKAAKSTEERLAQTKNLVDVFGKLRN